MLDRHCYYEVSLLTILSCWQICNLKVFFVQNLKVSQRKMDKSLTYIIIWKILMCPRKIPQNLTNDF